MEDDIEMKCKKKKEKKDDNDGYHNKKYNRFHQTDC